MSDSNPQPVAATNPTSAPPQAAPEQKAEPKTFTQRFQEMERSVMQLQFVLQYYNNIIQNSLQQMKLLNNDISSIKETVNAMLKLGDAGLPQNSVNTVNKMTEVSAENHKKAVLSEVTAGRLKEIETVTSNTTIVSFSSDDVVFGYNLVSAFQDEDVKAKAIGAKVGDKVGPYTLLGIYEEVATQPTGASDEQAPQEQNQAQQ